jgi:hypothetical protein
MINTKGIKMFFSKDFLRWKYIVVLLFFVVTLSQAVPMYAKMYEKPKSFSLEDKSLKDIDRKVLKEIDPESLIKEDLKYDKVQTRQRPRPLRFAVAEDVKFDMNNSGTWQDIQDGRIWRLIIKSPGAKSLNLGFTRFDLPEGVKLWIYDTKFKHIEGPFTSNHRSQHGRFWTSIIEGDEIVIEIFVPARVKTPSILIGKANKGYRSFEKDKASKQGSCNNDVICPEGDPWRDQIRSVARYTISGMYLCSGQLMNNTGTPRKNYFLSAYHCGVDDTNDDSLIFYWNYESPNCGDLCCGSLSNYQMGSYFRASYSPSDFVLVELADPPDASANVYYSGWDANGVAPATSVCIHHPSGDEKAISFNNNAVMSTAYLSNTYSATGNHWRVDDWEDGTTEPGSSGSCLWDGTSQRCVGQLHGGYASCSNPNDPDWYGKLSVSWIGGGTDSTRLSNWLDEGNTGVTTLNGDPHNTTLDGIRYDFQGAGEYVALRDNSGLEIQVRQTPIATTFNPGPDSYDGLATCVSINTAVAARVGEHRVTYQPNISGVPDPSGLQLRIDGVLTTLSDSGLDFGDGGRILKMAASGGLEIDFPDGSILIVTPNWWSSQSKWYLNVSVTKTSTTSIDGASNDGASSFVSGGLMAAIAPGSWLPVLPDGTTLGPMPGSLHQRYIDLYHKFGNAWRVTDKSSLFDYAPGTSTASFTMLDWPLENPPCVIPETKPVKPATELVAQQACKKISDKNEYKNCVFDVIVTGETGFAEVYLASQNLLTFSTITRVIADENPTQVGEWVTFTAQVRTLQGRVVTSGDVQFMLDGAKIGDQIRLDSNGHALWETSRLKAGRHYIAAIFEPDKKSKWLPSTSPQTLHTVRRCICIIKGEKQ